MYYIPKIFRKKDKYYIIRACVGFYRCFRYHITFHFEKGLKIKLLSLIWKGVAVVAGERNTGWWIRIVVWTQRTRLWLGYCFYRRINGQHSVVCVKMTDSNPVFDPKVFCSAELNAGLHNQLICFTIVSIIVALTAVVGNTLILIALHKESSLRQPSKILLCSLASSDLCLGFSTLVFATCWLSTVLQQKWQSCQYVYLAYGITAVTLFGVSLFTTTAVSVDRLLALLLGLRYRLIVTVKRVYATVVVIWVFPILGIAVEFYTKDERRIFASSCIMLSLILAMCCYLKIYLKLRRRQIHVRETNLSTPVSLARYRKTVHNALWVQLAFVVFFVPFCVIAPFAYPAVVKEKSVAFFLALVSASTLLLCNSSLNPFLYCWKIKQVRRAVKNTLSQFSCSLNG